MSWTHSSKAVAVGVLLAVALAAMGTAAAVTFVADDPEDAEVGESVTFEVEMTEVFEDLPNEWTLEGETDLEEPTWQLIAEDVSGANVEETETNSLDLSSEDGVDRVIVEVQGEVPEMSTFSYENIEDEEYLVLELSQSDGPSLEEWHAHRFTADSQDARESIDEAVDATDSEEELATAISAYDSENFENAIELAEEAGEEAESGQQRQQLLTVGGIAVAALLVIGGGYYLYQQRQQDRSKLQ